MRIGVGHWTRREWAALAAVHVHGHALYGPQLELLRQRFAARFPHADVFPVNAGRTALKIALRAMLANAEGSRCQVIVPDYICPSVVDAVREIGLQPVGVPVAQDLNIDAAALAKLVRSSTLAVVVAHMYGKRADMSAVRAAVSERGVYVIDDAAQSMAPGSEPDRQSGGMGDVGVFSFAQSKPLVVGDSGAGGVLLVNNRGLVPAIETQLAALLPPEFSGSSGFGLSLWMPGLSERWKWYRRRLTGHIGGPRQVGERQMANGSAALALIQLDSLARRLEDKKRVFQAYCALAALAAPAQFPQCDADEPLLRVMLDCGDPAQREKVRARLVAQAIPTRRPYTLYDLTDKPNPARVMAERMLELPSPFGLGEGAIERIMALVARALKSGGNTA